MGDLRSVELARCGRIAIERCLGVRPGERVVVVTDTLRDQGVTEALLGAARAAGAEATAVIFAGRDAPPGEPPAPVAAAMRAADALLLHTTRSLTHSQARVEAQQAGARVISMPGVSEATFLRTLSVDMDALADLTGRLAARVQRARTARITTALGTDVQMALSHAVLAADGICTERGALDFFPPGLILQVPDAGSVEGEAVVDGSITLLGRLSSPVTIVFRGGQAVEFRGGPEARRLGQMLAALEDPGAYNFAAWGMGTNPGAVLLGDDPSFEGERIHGWAHVSTGSNATLAGGSVRAKIHLDAIIGAPRVELDGEPVLDEGRFLV